MLVGYARVSTADQDLTLQTDALTKAGCEKLFTDKVSGAKLKRPGLTEALNFVRAGDTLVIWKLDRLGRSIGGLIELAADLSARKIDFRSLTDGFDTATPSGRLLFHILASVAEMERELIKERTIAGLAAARAKGSDNIRRMGIIIRKSLIFVPITSSDLTQNHRRSSSDLAQFWLTVPIDASCYRRVWRVSSP